MSSSQQISIGALRDSTAKGKCLVAISGKVYDLTTFQDVHPGGKLRLQLAAGRDATVVVETTHEPSTLKILDKYYVGELLESNVPSFGAPNEFALQLRKRVKEYFRHTGQDPKYCHYALLQYAIPIIGISAGYWALHWFKPVINSLGLSAVVLILWSWSYFGFAVYWVHDGSHSATTHNPKVWDAMTGMHNVIFGISDIFWYYKHVLGHHPYTNVVGADPDIATEPFSPTRYLPSQAWFPIYAAQLAYAPIIYGFWTHYARLGDIIAYASQNFDTIPVNPFTKTQALLFWGGKVIFFIYRVIIPIFLSKSSKFRVISLFLASEFITSWFAAFIFEANHVVDGVHWYTPEKDNTMNVDWAILQIQTAQDYSHGNRIVTFLTGSLNYQVVHHLFPHINQCYYPDLAKIVKQTCAEYGVDYRVLPSPFGAVRSHLSLLSKFAKKEK